MSKLFKWFKKDAPESPSDNAQTAEDKQQSKLETTTESRPQVDQDQALSDDTTNVKAQHSEIQTLAKDDLDIQNTPEDVNDAISKSVAEHSPDADIAENAQAQTPAEEAAANNSSVAQDNHLDSEQKTKEASGETENALGGEEASEEKDGLFARLKASLSRTKTNIGSGFSNLLLGKNIDDELYEELETQLLLADVGMNTTNKIIEQLTNDAKRSQLKDGEALSAMLQAHMQSLLDSVNRPLDFSLAQDESGTKQPFVILMVGVNGVGKTTTIGKLAKQFQREGKSVMLAAGDTFRAAAVEQLQVWGERNDIPVVAQNTGSDSASVIYDAIESAKAKNIDVLIADTAGRLQNKDHLIEELKKVVRVMKKLNPKAPHEVMLTLDASTGQNAVSQTRIFNQAVGITGINLTKLDGTAKGGVIFALADEFNIPVRYIGLGEGIDDLRVFDSKTFVEALFSE